MATRSVTRLYAFGSNGCGQLGVGHVQDLSAPQRSGFITEASAPSANTLRASELHDEQIMQVVAGGNHTIVLTWSGNVYAAGANHDGRCGVVGSNDNVTQFMVVRFTNIVDVTAIAATWEASFVVNARRSVLAFGAGSKGELGLGEGITGTDVPQVVFDVAEATGGWEEIVQIAASMSHVVVLLSNGCIYGWGSCRKGQLGEDWKLLRVVWKPRLLQTGFKVRRVAVGRDYSFLAGVNGECAMLGDQRYFVDESVLARVAETNMISGWSSMLGLEKDRIIGVGRNDKGQLPADGVPPVSRVAAGSEHALAYTIDDAVLAWGWGEHGNCGAPVDGHGNVAGRVNHIHFDREPDETIAGLAAGCATSFIWTTREK